MIHPMFHDMFCREISSIQRRRRLIPILLLLACEYSGADVEIVDQRIDAMSTGISWLIQRCSRRMDCQELSALSSCAIAVNKLAIRDVTDGMNYGRKKCTNSSQTDCPIQNSSIL